MKKKIIIGIIIVIALSLMIIPSIKTIIEEQNGKEEQVELLDEVNDIIENEEPTEPSTEEQLSDENTSPPTTQPYRPYRTSTNEDVDGVLKIPKIDLELPILTNVTEKGLKKTCARVTNTNPPGSPNYCVMGHTMNSYGLIFNRLRELKKDDVIIVKARDYTYTYKVYKIFTTNGLDVSILEDEKNITQITLFCCSYNVKNGRLVIKGELIEKTQN